MSVFRVILVRIFSSFSRICTENGEMQIISPYSVWMPENVGKMLTRITPNTDTFNADTVGHRSLTHWECSEKFWKNIGLVLCLSRVWNRRSTLYNIFCWKAALRYFFCVPKVVYLCDHQMSIARHFSMDSVKSQFETMAKIEF